MVEDRKELAAATNVLASSPVTLSVKEGTGDVNKPTFYILKTFSTHRSSPLITTGTTGS